MFYSEEGDDGSMSESWIGVSMCVCVCSVLLSLHPEQFEHY